MSTIGRVDTQTASDVDVIAALRIAELGTTDWDRFGKVVSEILKAGRDTPTDNVGGLQLLLRLQRQGALEFELRND